MVVGVPSGQAANCFIEAHPFDLGYSGIVGQISVKLSVNLPDDPKNARLLLPDAELTYAAYAAMAFDPNASVRLALTRANDGDRR
jgi:hypothetical protein